MIMLKNGHMEEILNTIIQLSFDKITFTHTLVVIQNGINIYDTLITAHTNDTFGKRVSEYSFKKYRCLHIIS